MTVKTVSGLALAELFLHLNARPVWAHPGAPLAPHDLWQAWNPDLVLILSLGVAAWRYGVGPAELWRRVGRAHGVTSWQSSAFYAGLLVLFVVLVSPLDALSGVLFAAHMGQVAAP